MSVTKLIINKLCEVDSSNLVLKFKTFGQYTCNYINENLPIYENCDSKVFV